MSRDLLFEKLKKLPINPYVVNWIISFLGNRRQRVFVDGIVTEYLNNNRVVPQGTVIGPICSVSVLRHGLKENQQSALVFLKPSY